MSELKRILKEVPLLVLAHGDKSYIVKTPQYLDSADGSASDTLSDSATRLFPDLDPHTLRFQASFAGHDRPHTLTADAYLATLTLLTKTASPPPVLQVVSEKSSSRKRQRSASCESAEASPSLADHDWANDPDGEAYRRQWDGLHGLLPFSISVQCRRDAPVSHLKAVIASNEGYRPFEQRLVFNGTQLEDNRSLRSYGIRKEATLHLALRLGKQGVSIASWTVSAEPDGSLVELASGLALSYLFWEAHSLLLPPSPPASPSLGAPPAFDPSRPSLSASTGVALPFSSFLPYLDTTLSSLTLHTAARNDFVTYWLPSFNRIHARNQHIAFRFLPQAEYEQAAQLEVDPKPDVVTRVFMLFKGVDKAEAEGWRKPDEVDWVSEVGVRVDEATDEGLFRVLEWGGNGRGWRRRRRASPRVRGKRRDRVFS